MNPGLLLNVKGISKNKPNEVLIPGLVLAIITLLAVDPLNNCLVVWGCMLDMEVGFEDVLFHLLPARHDG